MSKVKYSTYKPSKTLWQEQIPSHWQETELRMLFADNKNKNIGLVEKNLLSLSYGKLKRKDIDNATGLVPASFEGYQIIDKGYIVLRFTDLQNDKKSLRVGYANEKGIITNAYVGLAPKADFHSKYFYYQLHVLDKIKYFYNLGGGVRQSLAYKEFGRETILIPEKEEQSTIARFLDFKLAKIDRFIRKKKQLKKLLNEQKAAIINQAVTKGLDPNAKMKPSGIEWLGDIPEHWNLKRLRFLLLSGDKGIKIGPFGSAIKSDIIHSKEFYISKGVKCFKVYGQEHAIASDFNIGNKYISEESYQKLSGYTLMSGDIIITMMGTIGKSKVVPDNVEDGIMDSHLIRIGINPETSSYYISFLINDSACLSENMRYESKGSIMSGLNSKIIKSLYIPLPPIVEQQQIIEYIEKEISKLNQTVSTIVKEINLVEEYKTALIAEAVTGKINVRDFEIPKTLEVEIYDELEEELSMVAEEEAEYETKDIE